MSKNSVSGEKASEIIKNNKYVVVDFFASWCGPCQMFGPVFDEVAESEKVAKMISINVDENNKFSYENNISSIPTVVFYKNGKEEKRFLGFKPVDKLKKEIEKFVK